MQTTTAQLTVVHHGRSGTGARGWILDHLMIPARPETGTVVQVIDRYRHEMNYGGREWRVVPSPWHTRRVTAWDQPPVYENVDPNPHGRGSYQDSFRLQAFIGDEAQNQYLDVGIWVDTSLAPAEVTR